MIHLEIQIGEKYLITSDEYNLVLKEKKVSEKGKEYMVNLGYFGKLEHLVSALLLRDIRESEAKSIQELIIQLESAQNGLKIEINEKVKAYREINVECDSGKWF